MTAVAEPTVTTTENTVLTDIEHRLIVEFPDVAAADITTAVTRAYRSFDSSRIRDFIPLFVEKRVRRQFAPQFHPACA